MDYNKTFRNGKTELCRADLESLPCPFCTENVSDKEMQAIVDEVEMEMTEWRDWCKQGDITKDVLDEKWWEILERTVCKHNVPYYEDLED